MPKYKWRGKLNLASGGDGFHIICHNFPEKKKCDDCLGCFAEDCSGIYCDAKGNCQCSRTECICLGRKN